MRVVGLWLLAGALSWAISSATGCSTQVRSTDGNTSWLRGCTADKECNGGECKCGVCTDVCEETAACPNAGSRCVRSGSSAFTAACGESSTVSGVCLPECPTEGCGAGRICNGGACVLSESHPAPGSSVDAGATPDAGMPPAPSDAAVPQSSSCMNVTGSPASTPISFRNDVLPMFGLSCVVSDCHGPSDHKAGLNLGYKCAFDANAKWKCTFPTMADPDKSQPQPDDEQTVADIYASLLAPSLTVSSPVVNRVEPGDPANSFLVLKLANQQSSRGYTCVNQDPSHESAPPECGVSMPQNQALYCEGSSQPKFQAIIDWIAQGAPNN